MADGSLIPNTYQSPNEYVDFFMPLLVPVNANEFVVLIYAVRHILGWKESRETLTATISMSHFMDGVEGNDYANGCGLTEAAVRRALGPLTHYGILVKEGDPGPRGQRYRLQLDKSKIKIAGLMNRLKEKRDANQRRTKEAMKVRREKKAPTSDVTPSESDEKGEVSTSDVGIPPTSDVTPKVPMSDITPPLMSDVGSPPTSDNGESNPYTNPSSNQDSLCGDEVSKTEDVSGGEESNSPPLPPPSMEGVREPVEMTPQMEAVLEIYYAESVRADASARQMAERWVDEFTEGGKLVKAFAPEDIRGWVAWWRTLKMKDGTCYPVPNDVNRLIQKISAWQASGRPGPVAQKKEAEADEDRITLPHGWNPAIVQEPGGVDRIRAYWREQKAGA